MSRPFNTPEKQSDLESLDRLIRAITEEVLAYLGADRISAGSLPGEADAWRGAKADLAASAMADANIDANISKLIDHTLLKPNASRSDIEKLCREAVHFGFASVCVNPWYVPLAAQCVRGSAVKVCTVVGFPLGATLPQLKRYEAEEAIKLGAREIDMVENIGALKSGQDEQVEADIRGVVEASHRGHAICKVILETALLTDSEKVRASMAAKRAGADFVKTSTGFAPAGATAEDVALMRATVGSGLGIKASGGIRTLADLEKMVRAGATRIGASAGVKIMEQARDRDSESSS